MDTGQLSEFCSTDNAVMNNLIHKSFSNCCRGTARLSEYKCGAKGKPPTILVAIARVPSGGDTSFCPLTSNVEVLLIPYSLAKRAVVWLSLDFYSSDRNVSENYLLESFDFFRLADFNT